MLEQFETLTPSMRLAARFIIDHPNEVVIGSMRSLARRGKAADLASELFAVQRANLDATEAGVAPGLRQAARLLIRARHVHIAGFRASHPMAFFLFYGYLPFRNTVSLLDLSATGLEAQMRAIEKGDAVVIISFAPYSSESLRVARSARDAGVRVIALTDSSASPLALDADEALVFSVSSPSFFPSIAAGVAVAEALLEQLVAEGGEDAVTRIDEAEASLFESGAYVERPWRRTPDAQGLCEAACRPGPKWEICAAASWSMA